MYKVLYFKTPTFDKEKWEEKIVNELGCSLYNVVKKQRYFESDKYLVIMNKKLTMVYCDISDYNSQKKAREIFYKKKGKTKTCTNTTITSTIILILGLFIIWMLVILAMQNMIL